MAPRTITYRTKTGPGAWQRAIVDDAALPQAIPGAVNGTIYEVDTGKGGLVEVTPAAIANVVLTPLAAGPVTWSSQAGSTSTWANYSIADAVGPKLLISIGGRPNGAVSSLWLAVNGGSEIPMIVPVGSGNMTSCVIVDKPAGSTMSFTIRSNSTSVGSSGDVHVAVYDVSSPTAAITGSFGDPKDILTTDQTWAATLNVPQGGAVFAMFMPRSSFDTSPAVLSGVDRDLVAAVGSPRTWHHRDGLAANASYPVSITARRTAGQTGCGFGAFVIAP